MSKIEYYCRQLLHAKSEEAVTEILQNMESKLPVTWKPYGGNSNNYSTFENQQTSAEGALIEKITNCMDHMLIRQCLVKGIEPTSTTAPRNMYKAKELFFDNKDSLSNADSLYNKPWVIADGVALDKLNLIIADTGEGQLPKNFERTLLSLQQGNKNDIAFVQGMFNMGSTGAVRFCGNNKYQFMMSKRHSALNDADGNIGFTLVRRHTRTPEEQVKLKNTWYEYLVINDTIPTFAYTQELHLTENDDSVYKFRDGTVIKLFNYQLKSKSQVFQSLRYQIESFLYNPTFEVAVCETRKSNRKSARKEISNFAYGNQKILEKAADPSQKSNVKLELHDSITVESSIWGRVPIDFYVLDKSSGEFNADKNLVFLQNGQVQYFEKTSFVAQKLQFKLLKKDLYIIVDCSSISQSFRDQGLFMANRENIVQNEGTEAFMNAIISALQSNESLIECNRKRAEINVSSTSTQQLMEKILGRGGKDDFLRTLFDLKDTGRPINQPGSSHNSGSSGITLPPDRVELFEFPSYINFVGAKDGLLEKELPLNGSKSIKVELNANNDYFTRITNPGIRECKYLDISKKRLDITWQPLNNGHMKINFKATNELSIGDTISMLLKISDIHGSHECAINFIIKEPIQKEGTKANSGINLPALIPIYKDQATIDNLSKTPEEKSAYQTWATCDRTDAHFDENKIVYLAEGADTSLAGIYVNMSSKCLANLKYTYGTTETKKVDIEDIYLSDVYLESFLLFSSFEQQKKSAITETATPEFEATTLVEKLIKHRTFPSVAVKLMNRRSDD